MTPNFFALLQLPVSFELDDTLLYKNYLQAQKQVHPDQFVQASEAEKRIAMQWSSLINEAYQTLKNSLNRANYLLKLQGNEVAHNATLNDHQFLFKQIELREKLEELNPELPSYAQQQKAIANEIAEAVKDCKSNFAEQYQTTPALAAQTLQKWQFFDKLQDELNKYEISSNQELNQQTPHLIAGKDQQDTH
jgi:molecular chaperone HscB